MRNLIAAVFAAAITLGAVPAIASAPVAGAYAAEEISHGGGCRKSSPPGQCCHMDNSVGEVHCH